MRRIGLVHARLLAACILVPAVICAVLSGCGTGGGQSAASGDGQSVPSAGETEGSVKADEIIEQNMDPSAFLVVAVGDNFFTVDLADNASADAFFEKVRGDSLTVRMHDYGGFEKVGELPFALPENNEEMTTKPGDLILYQGNQITVYYGENTWNLTKLGRLNATEEEILEAFGGKEDITAEFYLEWTE